MFQVKVQLKEIKSPPIWRNLILPNRITFFELHHIIQIAFGLYDMHLFNFTKKSYPFEINLEYMRDEYFNSYNEGINYVDADKTLVFPYLLELNSLDYTYDFGDNWEFKITLMKVKVTTSEEVPSVVSFRGENISEDCGGPGGLEEIRELAKTPDSKEYQEWVKWNPRILEDYDLPRVNKRLAKFYRLNNGDVILPYHIYDSEVEINW
uniref:plasmid pRiA4b ORF-3 family protein n=1 Tax=Globicatella sulfidifaciens TaxID=136093 RepID=UPI0023F4C4FB|nr:plasmid pRiA4b ORF-3 family protein [Globicatella sulfidifaciens]